jgi:glycine hydroxymethyltransferase
MNEISRRPALDLNRESLQGGDPEVYKALEGEEERQSTGVELIPSENYTYPEVLAVLGSVFTNKYSEGYPGRRYYGGQEYTDVVEELARERARRLFRAEHANVQPLSGSPMNQAVYFGCLSPGDTILAMDLSHGGHLTHGAPVSHMGKVFRFVRYRTRTDRSGAIDFDEVRALALEHRPKMVLCGHSSYPRELDYQAFKRVADEVGALTMADISHLGGLVAGGVSANPLDAGFDIVTTTTHKSLRGPRGGMILCRAAHARSIDSSVFPGLQGGPHMNAVAGAAITLGKALQTEFREYSKQVCVNARALAGGLLRRGATLVTGGTDNHLMVVDTVCTFGVDGQEAERALDRVGITTNKQIIPDDPRPPLRPSGIRVGTPACTTRGMGTDDMEFLAGTIFDAIVQRKDEDAVRDLKAKVRVLCARLPVPGLYPS